MKNVQSFLDVFLRHQIDLEQRIEYLVTHVLPVAMLLINMFYQRAGSAKILTAEAADSLALADQEGIIGHPRVRVFRAWHLMVLSFSLRSLRDAR